MTWSFDDSSETELQREPWEDGGSSSSSGGSSKAATDWKAQLRQERWQQLREDFAPLFGDGGDPRQGEMRLCTDVPCVLLLSLVVWVAIIAAGLSSIYAEPANLAASWNGRGRLCGVHPLDRGRPFLYWPMPEDLSVGKCVARCPTVEDQTAGQMETFVKLGPLRIRADGNLPGSNRTVSQEVRKVSAEVYPTNHALGLFCLPSPGIMLPPPNKSKAAPRAAPLDATMDESNVIAGVQANSMISSLQNSIGQAGPQLRRAAGELRACGTTLAICILIVPFVVTSIFLVCLIMCPVAATWCLVVVAGVGALALGSHTLVEGFVDEKPDSALETLGGLQLAFEQTLGWGLMALGTTVLLAAFWGHEAVKWAALSGSTAVRLVYAGGLAFPILVVSALAALAQAIAVLTSLWLLESALSAAYIHWPDQLLVHSEDSGSWYTDALPGLLSVKGISQQLKFYCPPVPCVFVALTFLDVSVVFILEIGKLVVAYLIGHWYFHASSAIKRRKRHRPSWARRIHALSAHLGTAFFSAMLHGVLPVGSIRACVVVLHKRILLHRASGRSILCEFISSFGASPLTFVALEAASFTDTIVSSASAVRPPALLPVQLLLGTPQLLESVVKVLVAALAAEVLILSIGDQSHASTDYVELHSGLAILAGVVASSFASTWLLICNTSFDAMLCCFLCDDDFEHDVRGLSKGGYLADTFDARESHRRRLSPLDSSYALWISDCTPPRLRSLILQAAANVNLNGAAAAAWKRADNNGYDAVASGSPSASTSSIEPD